MQKRYIAALGLAIFAGVGMHPATETPWPVVAVLTVAAIMLVGAHAVDGLSMGPISVDADDE